MTELLYFKDCYLKEFEAEVVSVNGKFIELNRTAFYPESGGQPTDFGKLISKAGMILPLKILTGI